MNMRERALLLAGRGFEIFRVKWMDKTPLGKWKDIATKDHETIEDWPAKGYNIGVACGERSGAWVLDIDDEEAMVALQAAVTLPATYTIKTGKGYHLYFKWADGMAITNSHQCPIPKIDVRGNGGYVVAEGSTHANGHIYHCIDETDCVPAPADLLALLWPPKPVRNPTPPAAGTAPKKIKSRKPGRYDAYVDTALNNILEEFGRTTQNRNHALNRAAFACGKLIAAEWACLDRTRCELALETTARNIGLEEREIAKSIKSGITSGMLEPREEPEEKEMPGHVAIDKFREAQKPQPEPQPQPEVQPEAAMHAQPEAQPQPEASKGPVDWLDNNGMRILNSPDSTEMALEVLSMLRAEGEHIVCSLGQIWQYQKNRWRPIEEHVLNGFVQRLRGRYAFANRLTAKGERSTMVLRIEDHHYRAIRSIILTDSKLCCPNFFDNAPKGFAFRNGFLRQHPENVTPRLTLEPHAPEHRQMFVASFDYIKDAEAPVFRRFLGTVLPGDNPKQGIMLQDQLLQFVGACMMGDATKYQKAMLLYGEGANGKSTFMEIVKAIFHKEQISFLTPQDLCDDKNYRLIMLANALINMPAELPVRDLLESEKIKSVISGDQVNARQIREKAVTFVPKAGHLFAGNDLPKTSDQSYAFFRRFLVIPFTVIIPEEKRDRDLVQKITTKEMPGVVAAILEAYETLLEDKVYRGSQDEKQLNFEWRIQTDPMLVWSQEVLCRPSSEALNRVVPGRWFTAKEVYRDYSEWCKEANCKPFNYINFTRQIQRKEWQHKKNKYGSMLLLPLPKEVTDEEPDF